MPDLLCVELEARVVRGLEVVAEPPRRGLLGCGVGRQEPQPEAQVALGKGLEEGEAPGAEALGDLGGDGLGDPSPRPARRAGRREGRVRATRGRSRRDAGRRGSPPGGARARRRRPGRRRRPEGERPRWGRGPPPRLPGQPMARLEGGIAWAKRSARSFSCGSLKTGRQRACPSSKAGTIRRRWSRSRTHAATATQ